MNVLKKTKYIKYLINKSEVSRTKCIVGSCCMSNKCSVCTEGDQDGLSLFSDIILPQLHIFKCIKGSLMLAADK